MLNQKPQAQPRFPRSITIALIAIAALAALLRLVGNNQPFPTSDHAEVAAIVSYFYPRDMSSLGLNDASSWNMLTSVHGSLPLVIALISTSLIGIGGVHVNEFWWNLPFVLASLLSVVASGVFVFRIAGRRPAVIAALLITILPLHATISRTSGLGHITLMFLCQLLTVWAFLTYVRSPTPQSASRAGITLAIALTVELFFPLLFALVGAVVWIGASDQTITWSTRFFRTHRLLFNNRVMLLPLLVLIFNLGLMVAYGRGWIDQGGMAARLMQGSNRTPGLYIVAFWQNAAFVVGPLACAILFALGLCLRPLKLDERAIPLVWAAIYLVPFMLFTRANFYGYLLLGMAPLALNAAIVLGDWLGQTRWSRAAALTTLAALVALMSLRSTSMIFGQDFGPVVGQGIAQGAIYPDQGLKAAAGWVRSQSASTDVMFADNTFEPYQLSYYLHRPFIALTDAQSADEVFALLPDAPRQPVFYLVTPANAPLLERYAATPVHLRAQISANDAVVLHVYGQNPGATVQIDATTGNSEFDKLYGDWRNMFQIGVTK